MQPMTMAVVTSSKSAGPVRAACRRGSSGRTTTVQGIARRRPFTRSTTLHQPHQVVCTALTPVPLTSRGALGRSFVGGKRCISRGRVRAAALPDPWGVSAESWESIEANLFAVSLFPYLAFLWLLDRPETKCPPRVSFAFKFLLVFVFATIPAGIYAKVHYHDILANVDWLHGTAESMLTVTNLLLVLGLRDAIGKGGGGDNGGDDDDLGSIKRALLSTAAGLTLLGGVSLPGGADAVTHVASLASTTTPFALHPEPTNALSVPTWAVHTSSVIEYLVGMGLVWSYADVSGNPRWKGLTWGMLPSHSSGITACVYHVFYNAPSLSSVVALQAMLTVVGNTTCAIAAYRIWRYGAENADANEEDTEPAVATTDRPTPSRITETSQVGWEDLAQQYASDSDLLFVLKIGGWSFALGAVIKYGELALDAPFQEGQLLTALACIAVPSLLNVSKWASLSIDSKEAASR